MAGNTSVDLCPVPAGIGRRVLLLLLLVVVSSSSSSTALASEHLLEEVELRGDCAQQGKEKREEELLTHCAL